MLWSRRSSQLSLLTSRGEVDRRRRTRPARRSREVVQELADKLINVDMIEQNVSLHGTTDISFTVPHADLAAAKEVIDELKEEIGASATYADPIFRPFRSWVRG